MSSRTVNRIPAKFFATKGAGSSDNQIHAGSYHMALHEAGISDYNIQTYSSVLPACAREVMMKDADLPEFGSEMMTIMAVANGKKGERISAGIVHAWMYDFTGKKIGGLVCEVSGKMDRESLRTDLQTAILELHSRTYGQYKLGDLRFLTNEYEVDKAYGTVLTALCFTEYK